MFSTTSPLAKLIRTTEGALVVVSNIALVAVPIITTHVPASLALKLGVILNGTTLVARQVLKGVALFAGVTGLEPIDPGSAAADLPVPLEQAIAEVEAATDVSVAQTVAEQLTPQPAKTEPAPEPAPAPAPAVPVAEPAPPAPGAPS